MDFSGTLKILGDIDSEQLQYSVQNCTEADWQENLIRQQQFEVHYQTQSLILQFCDCDDWPKISVRKEHAWKDFAPQVMPIIEGVLGEHYPPGGKIIRIVLAKLDPGAIIKPHVDSHPSFAVAHRIHVPITTNPKVRFNIGGKPHHLEVGKAYEVNNLQTHSVMNKGYSDRVTLIFDYVPPANLPQVEIEQTH